MAMVNVRRMYNRNKVDQEYEGIYKKPSSQLLGSNLKIPKRIQNRIYSPHKSLNASNYSCNQKSLVVNIHGIKMIKNQIK